MSFTTQIFTFVFMPLSLCLYYLTCLLENVPLFYKIIKKVRAKDMVLIFVSIAFYMWTCFDDVFRLLLYILMVYIAGYLISRVKKKENYFNVYSSKGGETVVHKIYVAVFLLLAFIIIVLFCLVHFKYTNLLITLWNWLFRGTITMNSIAAPLGISFITFSSVSYLVDIYRGSAKAGTLIDCALYLSFFPKVVSGPTVLWKNFQPMIYGRHIDLKKFTDGLNRIMIGFAKKLILADTFGTCISQISVARMDVITAWGSALVYMLQIYYDFSGYSDIAIGLAKVFGFDFENNFNFPYISKSISEFWRRWHVSLGMWFREYVYFPLGGSKKGKKRTLINLAVVFVLTGVWHGAGWTYILWGGINGAVAIIERIVKDKHIYQSIPVFFKWFATMALTLFCWQFFRFSNIDDFLICIRTMFGMFRPESIYYTWQYYFDTQLFVFVILGSFGATALASNRLKSWYSDFSATKIGFVIQEIILLLLFSVAILFMVNSTYHPFIYFQY